VTAEPTSDRVRHALAFPIETPRLVIRSFEIGDAEMLHERVFGDDETMRFIPRGASPSVERTRGAVERFIRHEREHGFGLWAVELRATGEFIGDCGLVYVEARVRRSRSRTTSPRSGGDAASQRKPRAPVSTTVSASSGCARSSPSASLSTWPRAA